MNEINISAIRRIEERLEKTQLTEDEKTILRTERKVLTQLFWPDGPEGTDRCPPGYEFCPRCGHMALFEEFLAGNKCPNSRCLDPCFGLGPTWAKIGIFSVLLNAIVQTILEEPKTK